MTEQSTPSASRVTCKATKDPSVRVFIMAAMLLGFGIYCFIDAYIKKKYPAPEAWDMNHINEAAGYVLNHYLPFLAIPGGLILAIVGLVMLKRVLIADKEGIGYKGKPKLAWDQASDLNASELKDKGILEINYKDGSTLKLDQWKLQNFKELVAFVESHVK